MIVQMTIDGWLPIVSTMRVRVRMPRRADAWLNRVQDAEEIDGLPVQRHCAVADADLAHAEARVIDVLRPAPADDTRLQPVQVRPADTPQPRVGQIHDGLAAGLRQLGVRRAGLR